MSDASYNFAKYDGDSRSSWERLQWIDSRSIDRRVIAKSRQPSDDVVVEAETTVVIEVTARINQSEIPMKSIVASVGGISFLVFGIISLFLIAVGIRSAVAIGVCYLIPIGLWMTYLGLKAANPYHASA